MATKYTVLQNEETLLAHDTRIAELTKKYVDRNKGADTIIVNEDQGEKITSTADGEFKFNFTNPNAYYVHDNTLHVNFPAVPDRTTTLPKVAGTAAVGTENAWAAGDHVHPTDESRASKAKVSALESALHTLEVKLSALTAATPDDLDTLKEIVDYIKANRTLIENVTTTKVNVSDMSVMNASEAQAIAETACRNIYGL